MLSRDETKHKMIFVNVKTKQKNVDVKRNEINEHMIANYELTESVCKGFI